MGFWREPRFWITALMVAGVVVLAVMGQLEGQAAVTFFAGMLARFGAGAVPGVKR
ncbi:MAG: hypothetical protein ACYTEQ_18185 [Planctomycetota bacterium]|jgi:hypothetical protein